MRFSDIVGQAEAKRRLLQSVAEHRVPHALLISGAEGTGGLPLALAFAQYMACKQRGETDSCGQCPTCRKMAALTQVDLHFCMPLISGAVKEGSEGTEAAVMAQWREMLLETPYANEMDWYERLGDATKQGNISAKAAEKVVEALWYKSYEIDYRFMLVWLPERLHPVAANRLLKIVEEPPEGTHFLFVSHHPEDILPTVLSRLQQIALQPVPEECVASALEAQGTAQSLAQDIARVCRGNYRQALALASGQAVSPYFELQRALYRIAFTSNAEALFDWVEQVTDLGREEQKAMLRYFAAMLREILMLNLGLDQLCYLLGEERKFAKAVSPYINGRNVGYLLDEYATAQQNIMRNANANIVFTDMGMSHFGLIKRNRL